MEKASFKHHFTAHCETGVICSLYEDKAITISEPMAFGIGSGLFFVYLPFLKVMGNPLVSYRAFPGSIFKKVCHRLGVVYKTKKFFRQASGEKLLGQWANEGRAVGVQANIYWLKYIPKNFRFHFNAHNLIVFGKKGDSYKVSDPLLEDVTECPVGVMTKARFSKGPLAPRGFLYYLVSGERSQSEEVAIRKGIKETVRRMLYSPVPIAGLKGMSLLSRSIRKWPEKVGDKKARLYLSSVVRMQEEIGTGGAGFRYIYSSFLKESADRLGSNELSEASLMMESVADEWRSFAGNAVKVCKQKEGSSFLEVADQLEKIMTMEKNVYQFLDKRFL